MIDNDGCPGFTDPFRSVTASRFTATREEIHSATSGTAQHQLLTLIP
ncbi:MAG: hypothetical protein P8179_15090 [Candidatus Thiodiazotropha sp.]